MKGYVATLSAAELMLLDGKCSPETQRLVDICKSAPQTSSVEGLSESESRMCAEIVKYAQSHGKLDFIREHIPICPCCNRKDGYYPVRRTSRHKVKGEPDYDRPKLFTAWDFSDCRVRFKNRISLGFCESCRDRVEPVLVSLLSNIKAEMPSHWGKVQSRWKRHDNRECSQCGWKGHEGQLKKLPAMMGGYYPGKCPSCGAENLAFGRTLVKFADGYELVSIDDPSVVSK